VELQGKWTKRCFDLIVAAIALAIVAPALALIALMVKVSSSGPVLYRGTRVGLDGKLFPC
jgi:lipopolysaccharide/colanic/teichoic acid biosynthesis glycosyltransferase